MQNGVEKLNLDPSERVVIDTAAMDWIKSPAAGVMRKPLERAGAESGHASSIVRYEPGARFDTHRHPGGEEILVLDGVFSDENGDYGPGTYIRNPPGSAHAPSSREGCTLFVKLHQFAEGDQGTVRIDTRRTQWLPGSDGLEVVPLHQFEHEHVALVKWPAGTVFRSHGHFGGEEVLVLSGELRDELGRYPALSWLRNPHLSRHHPFVEEETVIWVKSGHLFIEAGHPSIEE
jgi:anti-sigma factor ChrR (cupin superfamily)